MFQVILFAYDDVPTASRLSTFGYILPGTAVRPRRPGARASLRPRPLSHSPSLDGVRRRLCFSRASPRAGNKEENPVSFSLLFGAAALDHSCFCALDPPDPKGEPSPGHCIEKLATTRLQEVFVEPTDFVDHAPG